MKKVKLFVTDKGAKAPNSWKKGDVIYERPGTAEALVKAGYATEKEESDVKESKPVKEAKQKNDK